MLKKNKKTECAIAASAVFIGIFFVFEHGTKILCQVERCIKSTEKCDEIQTHTQNQSERDEGKEKNNNKKKKQVGSFNV